MKTPEKAHQELNNSSKSHKNSILPADTHIQDWLANIENKHTRRAYRIDLNDFMLFKGIEKSDQFKAVERSNIIAWRDFLTKQKISIRTIKRKMSAVSKFMDFLCDIKMLAINPSIGVQRPKLTANKGVTPAMNRLTVKDFLDSPFDETIKGLRDRAIIATLFYEGVRRGEIVRLKVKDIFDDSGVKVLRVFGKGNKVRENGMNLTTVRLIHKYFEKSGHNIDVEAPLFVPVGNRTKNQPNKHLDPQSIYDLVRYYVKKFSIELPEGFGVHGTRATAITNALMNGEDLNKVKEWAGHANIATTALYDKREHPPEDSPSHSVRY